MKLKTLFVFGIIAMVMIANVLVASAYIEGIEPVVEESSNPYLEITASCGYYCAWCEPINGDGACTVAASCC